MEIQIKLGKHSEICKPSHVTEVHWNEMYANKPLMHLNPNYEMYQAIEDRGFSFTLGAYAGDKLVGYSTSFIHTHLHDMSFLFCQNDMIFVEKEYRNTSTAGLQLVRATEKEASTRGARMMLWHARSDTPFTALLSRLRYSTEEVVYSKDLKGT